MFGKAHFATSFPFLPTGQVESVEGSARVDEDWNGPYFGFDHVELTLFGHNLRIADLMGRWNWAFGPPPFGLHYARYLFRDGDERGYERLGLMQPEAAGAQWDHRQTWRNRLPEEEHLTTWIADRACDWLRDVDGPFFGWVSFTDPHHPMDAPAPWCDRYAPEDVLEVLPTVHPDELDIEAAAAQAARARCARPAAGVGESGRRDADARRPRGDDRRLLRDGRAARPRDRARARRARRARAWPTTRS